MRSSICDKYLEYRGLDLESRGFYLDSRDLDLEAYYLYLEPRDLYVYISNPVVSISNSRGFYLKCAVN